MGTRNLTMVISDGETKVAQYGQWDGYPEGQGTTVLAFLQKVDLKKFRERLKSISFFSKKELQEIEKKDKETGGEESNRLYREKPWLSRDLGGEILNAIMYDKYTGNDEDYRKRDKKEFKVTVDKLQDQTSFAGDSLFCEWLWLIDLDKKTFEAYKGFNNTELAEGERFKYLEKECLKDAVEKAKRLAQREGKTLTKKEISEIKIDYYPVRHIVTFKLNKLPKPSEFIDAFEFLNEEEDQ